MLQRKNRLRAQRASNRTCKHCVPRGLEWSLKHSQIHREAMVREVHEKNLSHRDCILTRKRKSMEAFLSGLCLWWRPALDPK